jgi:hypothetical protein
MESLILMKISILITTKMQKDNNHLHSFLNLLNSEQVFHSYMTNTFMLNQINTMMKDLSSGKISERDLKMEITRLMGSVDMIQTDNIDSIDSMGSVNTNISPEEFYSLLSNVKKQTILNLIERRKN